ncbi:MAG: hypothetical protein E7441_02620 [Ruminococcaceae bacterium]|nr:hypothetical protein [Oscillospiraceae bacterium]
MNIMKKIPALLIVCMLSMMLPVTVSAAKVTKVVITAVEPVVGQTRSFSASVPETASTCTRGHIVTFLHRTASKGLI